jgi:hypothetical protein
MRLIGGLSKVTRQYCGLCWVMDSLDVLGMVCSFGSEPGEVVQAVVMSSMSRVIAARMRSGVPSRLRRFTRRRVGNARPSKVL